VEAAGCPVVAVTIDNQAGRRTETFERWRKLDKRDCTICHGAERRSFYRRKPMFDGIDTNGLGGNLVSMTWEHLRQLRKFTSMKLLVKGVETAEDAKLCIDAGMDGVLVSNHGGRAGESNRGTIDCLPEVVDATAGRVPVFIDGGIRRGSDVFKALALGARAVYIGRPYIWGLAAFGQPGVERVVDLLRLELELVMKQCGVQSTAQVRSSHIGRRSV
jgi:isopentenyl diphosphate isomerase/L-lactate dehydrogenase-like FMN-dependent dehydrogenase